MLANLAPIERAYRVPAAAALTLITLLLAGAARGLASRLSPWRAGMEMPLVGALAASAAYGVGALGSSLANGVLPAA